MSFPYLRAVMEMEPTWSTPSEFAVLVVLANYADREGIAFPSKPTIARHVGLQRRQVWTVTRELASQGLISIEPGAGPRGCDRYTLTFGPSESTSRTRTPTLAVQCQGEHQSTLAVQCQGENDDPGSQARVTLAVASADPGSDPGSPLPPIPNPKEEILREPAPSAPALHTMKKAKTVTFELLRSNRFAHKQQLADAVRAQLQDVDESALEVAVDVAWVGWTVGAIR